MFENISLAFQGIWGHKMRSILTMLGIIIGIAAIISIVSTIKGTNEQIKENLIGAGSNAVKVQLNQGDDTYDFSWNSIPSGVPVIDDTTLEQINAIPQVEVASLYTVRDYAENIFYENTSYNGKIYGVDSHYFDVYGYKVQWGRDFSAEDYEKYRKVVILDKTAYSSLYTQGGNPIDTCIEIKGEPFTVIGVVEQSSAFEPVINSISDYNMYKQESSGNIFIPSSTWCIPYQFDEPQMVALKAVSTDDMTTAGNETAKILNGRLTAKSDLKLKYKSEDLLEQAKNLQDLSASTNQQLIWIASISLLVGGIGVMNIMLVSVTERTREIGIRRAIGAKQRQIVAQFLIETVVLSFTGGLFGIGVGVLIPWIIEKAVGMPTIVSMSSLVLSLGISVSVGMIFGIYPAMRAAALDPIIALRHE